MRLPASAFAARVDGRMMLRVPGGEQGDALSLREAVEVGDFGETGGRRLFERHWRPASMHSRAIVYRGSGGVVIATASSPSTLRISSRQSVNFCPTPCPERLEVATSSKRSFPGIAGLLVLCDLA